MKIKNFLIFIITILFLVNFIITINAESVGCNEYGIGITHEQQSYLKTGQNYVFNLHAYNTTTGFSLGPSQAYCALHLYNSTGYHIIANNNISFGFTFYDYFMNIDGGNFSTNGEYTYVVACFSNDLTSSGNCKGSFKVTPTGKEFTISEAILFFFILGLLGLFLFFSIVGIRNVTSGTWLIAYICLVYVLLYALIGICYLLANNYLWNDIIIANILYIVWFIMGIGFLPFIIILTLYILGQEARAVLEKDFLKQGYSKEDARALSRRKR
jgi:hypothetical protein